MMAAIDALRVREDHVEVLIGKVLVRRFVDVPRTRRHARIDRSTTIGPLTRRELTILDEGLELRHKGIEGLEIDHLSRGRR